MELEEGRWGLKKTKERVVQTVVHLCLFTMDPRIPMLLVQLDIGVSMEFLRGTQLLPGSPIFSITYSLFLKILNASSGISSGVFCVWPSINRTSDLVNVTKIAISIKKTCAMFVTANFLAKI